MQQQQQAQSNSNGGAAAMEAFWSMVNRAEKKFSKIRDPRKSSEEECEAYFYKVFSLYTQLWKFQQENRHKLVEAGLARSDIGDIAARIAQLYLGHYLRTSHSSYLRESFVFYDAILSRDYFGHGVSFSGDLSLASKHLRFVSRFLTVCLLLDRRHTLSNLLGHLRHLLHHCSTTLFPESDFREWKHVLQELVRFLKSDSDFINIRPLRYSLVLDPDPESLKSTVAKRNLRLRNAVLTSYHRNEVKFSELTLDTFRMLQCLEWESSGTFYQPGGASGNCSQDIADPTLPQNPRKSLLFRPSVTHFLAVVGTICDELPPDGVLLIYLSASGSNQTWSPIGAEEESEPASSPLSRIVSDSERLSLSDRQSKRVISPLDLGCLQFSSRGNEGINCIYPSDLVPYTRRPLFLVIDGDNNDAFEAIHGTEKGETAAILLSPSTSYLSSSAYLGDHPSGSLFTLFLSAPVQAFCLLLGNSGSTIDTDTYWKAENLLSSSFNAWGSKLVQADDLHPVWAQILGDPFLRRLVLRFVFCRAVVASYGPTFNKEEFIPRCVPTLPESLLPSTVTCQTVVMQIAQVFGVASSFMISKGVENICGDETDSMSPSRIMS